ncbi:hypothetical protein Tco_0283738, partial [Tanacetum coccineum]
YCTKALATPEQMATGKEIPNPFIADSLLKTIRIDEMLLKIKSQSMICFQMNNKQIIIKEKLMIKEMRLDTICHTPKMGLDGIRVRGRDVITIRSQSNKERPLIMDV